MKDPVDHILRPRLPWRSPDDAPITECGYNATKVNTITRKDFHARVNGMGLQRTALLTCMTCSDAVRRWATWADDPRLAIGREVEWECRGDYWRGRNDRGVRLRDELTAIASLIEAHREEFDAELSGVKERREWNARKAAMIARPKVAKPRNGL